VINLLFPDNDAGLPATSADIKDHNLCQVFLKENTLLASDKTGSGIILA